MKEWKEKVLASFGHIGMGTKVGNTVSLDKDFDYHFDFTQDRIKYIQKITNEATEELTRRINIAIEKVEEYSSVMTDVQKDVDILREKYKDTKFLEINFTTNLEETVNMLDQLFSLIGQWAVLSVDNPRFYKKAHTVLWSFFEKEVANTDFRVKYLSEKYTVFGAKARGGKSIFDRCVYHYTNIFKKNKESK